MNMNIKVNSSFAEFSRESLLSPPGFSLKQSRSNLSASNVVEPVIVPPKELLYAQSSDFDTKQHSTVGCRVFFGNIPAGVSSERFIEVVKMNSDWVDSEYFPVASKWATALVTYSNPEHANAAVAFLHGKRVFMNAPYHKLVCCLAPESIPRIDLLTYPPPPPPPNVYFQNVSNANEVICSFPCQVSTQSSTNPANTNFVLLRDGPPGSNLFIYGIPSDWTEVTMMDLCQEWGHIVGIRVPAAVANPQRLNRGFGFVSYDNPQSAFNALLSLTGARFLGKPLKIQLKTGEEHLWRKDLNGALLHRHHQRQNTDPVGSLGLAVRRTSDACTLLFQRLRGITDVRSCRVSSEINSQRELFSEYSSSAIPHERLDIFDSMPSAALAAIVEGADLTRKLPENTISSAVVDLIISRLIALQPILRKLIHSVLFQKVEDFENEELEKLSFEVMRQLDDPVKGNETPSQSSLTNLSRWVKTGIDISILGAESASVANAAGMNSNPVGADVAGVGLNDTKSSLNYDIGDNDFSHTLSELQLTDLWQPQFPSNFLKLNGLDGFVSPRGAIDRETSTLSGEASLNPSSPIEEPFPGLCPVDFTL